MVTQHILLVNGFDLRIILCFAFSFTIIFCGNKGSKTAINLIYSDEKLNDSLSNSSHTARGISKSTSAGLTMIAKMHSPRAAHTAVRLNNGEVLICGGMTEGNALSSVEIYNPASKSFTQSDNLNFARLDHSATLLPNGKVLIAGGYNGSYLSSTEFYDPVLKTFTSGPKMNMARSGHTATILNNGKILFTGGVGTGWSFLSSAEVYDMEQNKFIPVNSMSVARESHTATLLKNGNVLITGGHKDRRENMQLYSSCEIFDVKSNHFTQTGNMNIARHKHDAVLLADGKVLITAGSDKRDSKGVYTSAEIYDPNSSQFSLLTSQLINPRYKHKGTSVLLTDNNVFIGGGSDNTEIYNYKTGKFIEINGNMGAVNLFSCATLLLNGAVLITGGYGEDNNSNNNAWLFVP